MITTTGCYNSNTTIPITDKPGKPAAPTASTITDTSVSLTWSPPDNDGGAEITNYVVEYRLEGAYKWTTANVEETIALPSYTVSKLKTDAVYEFRVAAENKAGVGPASDPSVPIRVKEPLGESGACECDCR